MPFRTRAALWFWLLPALPLWAGYVMNMTPKDVSVPKYGVFEATFFLGQTYANPFDPAQIDVTATFTSPTGAAHTVTGFYEQEYKNAGGRGGQKLTLLGGPAWKARFAPDEVGTWSYVITAKDPTGTTLSPAGTFQVTASASRGFVRVSPRDPAYFAFDDGTAFFLLGENMGWPNMGGTYDFDQWLGGLSQAGGNYVRVWQALWSTEIEWANSYSGPTSLPGDYTGGLQRPGCSTTFSPPAPSVAST
jgi:hypothetical protein